MKIWPLFALFIVRCPLKISSILSDNLVALSHISDEESFSDITYDSRKVQEGTLFVAIKGFEADGHRFIESALSKGATAIVSQQEPIGDTPWIQVKDVRQGMAQLAYGVFDVSLNNLTTIGITGTNGKTTIATLFNQLNHLFYDEKKCWLIGTAGNLFGKTLEVAERTTPEAVDLLRWISRAQEQPKALVMEVSSHALILKRLQGFEFDVAVYTNLTQDHLDFHGDMENYYEAKKLLFTQHLSENGIAIINIDDTYGKRLSEECSTVNCLTFGFDTSADVVISDVHSTLDGTFFRVSYKGKKYKINSPLVGAFNVSNLCSVLTYALYQEFDMVSVLNTVKTMTDVRGRMEVVSLNAPFTAIVDYAHTPDALKNILSTARKITKGKVIIVFGAGGDRDSGKRSIMAEIVSKNSDFAIITSDNPRTENPSQILTMVEQGMPLDFTYAVIEDRATAIASALSQAQKGDVVIIAGKGHETYQDIAGVKHHFDDREEVIKAYTTIVKGE